MRLATIIEDGRSLVAAVEEGRVLQLPPQRGFGSMRDIAAAGAEGLGRIRAWVEARPATAFPSLDEVTLGPVVPDPGAIYTVGLNYGPPGGRDDDRPARPLIYGKAASSVAAHGSVLTWDRTLTVNVDPEVELGVVIGREAYRVDAALALDHVLGYTCMNDVSSRDPWLDGDQWLLGKSFPGFCPVGPWIVTADELEPHDLRLTATIDGLPIQAGSTRQMRYPIAEVIAYLSHHVVLRPGDLIATGTPPRLDTPPGPHRHLEPGDRVTVSIERIGELTTTIA